MIESENSNLNTSASLGLIGYLILPAEANFDPAFCEASVRVKVTIFARVRPSQKENCNRMHRK